MKYDWTYIGDGVYARFDGYQTFISIDQDYIETNEYLEEDKPPEIALEPVVLKALVDYDTRVREVL